MSTFIGKVGVKKATLVVLVIGAVLLWFPADMFSQRLGGTFVTINRLVAVFMGWLAFIFKYRMN